MATKAKIDKAAATTSSVGEQAKANSQKVTSSASKAVQSLMEELDMQVAAGPVEGLGGQADEEPIVSKTSKTSNASLAENNDEHELNTVQVTSSSNINFEEETKAIINKHFPNGIQDKHARYEWFEACLKEISATTHYFPTAYEVFIEARARFPEQLTGAAYEAILHCCRKKLRVHEVRELFGAESRLLETISGREIIHWEHYDQAKQVVQWAKDKGIVFSSDFYDNLAASLNKTSFTGAMLSVAMAMERDGIQPSEVFYARLLQTMQKSGMTERASVLFSRLVESFQDAEGNGLSIMTYLIRMMSLVQSGASFEAETIWEQIKERFGADKLPSAAWNVRIAHLINLGKWNEVFDEVLPMMRSGQPQTQPTPNTARVLVRHFIGAFRKPRGRTSTVTLPGHLVPKALETIEEALQSWYTKSGEPSQLHEHNILNVNENGTSDIYALPKTFPINPTDYANLSRLYAKYDPKRVAGIFDKYLAAAEADKRLPSVSTAMCNAILSILSDRQCIIEWRNMIAEDFLRKFSPSKKDDANNKKPFLGGLSGGPLVPYIETPDIKGDYPGGMVSILRNAMTASWISILAMMERGAPWETSTNKNDPKSARSDCLVNAFTLDLIYNRLLQTSQYQAIVKLFEWHQEMARVHATEGKKIPAPYARMHYNSLHRNAYLSALFNLGKVENARRCLEEWEALPRGALSLHPVNVKWAQQSGIGLGAVYDYATAYSPAQYESPYNN